MIPYAKVSREGRDVRMTCPECKRDSFRRPSYLMQLGPNVKCPHCLKSMYVNPNHLGTVSNQILASNS